ncbi:MAG: biopolymer transport protein ExbD [Sphingobacteriales bacterium]|jgi:biopolymer transport protein ExbD
MSKFKKKSGDKSPGINTASLPDIVFMLLFFFMVTTVLRETTLKVKVTTPFATEVQKLEKKSLVSYIYIGKPVEAERFGTQSRIQLNDVFAEPNDIAGFIILEREKVDERLVTQMTASIRADKETKMGIVTDVKQELRKINSLKINYSTKKGDIRD